MTDCGEVITDDESDGEVEDNMPSLVEDSEEELEAEVRLFTCVLVSARMASGTKPTL